MRTDSTDAVEMNRIYFRLTPASKRAPPTKDMPGEEPNVPGEINRPRSSALGKQEGTAHKVSRRQGASRRKNSFTALENTDREI